MDIKPVNIGTKIKILEISEELLSKLPDEEVVELKTMIGEIHKIIEIEEWGGVWVEKEFIYSDNQISYQKICLDPNEIQIIS